MKKKKEREEDKNQAREPQPSYQKNTLRFFSSFKEQEEYELNEMAKLKPEQILIQLRRFINIAYGMKGYNPEKLPQKHSIKITNPE